MSDLIDRELKQTMREIAEVHNHFVLEFDEQHPLRGVAAAILTLATVTHHQNGTKP